MELQTGRVEKKAEAVRLAILTAGVDHLQIHAHISLAGTSKGAGIGGHRAASSAMTDLHHSLRGIGDQAGWRGTTTRRERERE